MKSYEKYYTEKLYPLQDGITQLLNSLNTPFYLTGGTALSRGYYQHRFSDDLDYFVNNDADFLKWIALIAQSIKDYCKNNSLIYSPEKTIISDSYSQFIIEKDDVILKLDFVNDVALHYGELSFNHTLGRIDTIRNILSNKITALFRYEPKDIVDIWIIAKNADFNWENIFAEAKEKELGVDPLIAAEIIQAFPIDRLAYIKWIKGYSSPGIISDLKTIVSDILTGNNNSLNKNIN